MRSSVPYKFLDITPEPELLNYDFNSITLDEWANHTKLKESFPVFREIYNFRILGVGDMSKWENPFSVVDIVYFNTENPVHALVMQEVKKLEKLYNAKALIGVLDGMPPGTGIYRHWDLNPIFENSHRVHLPLVTHPDVKFYIDDVEYHFPAGQFYEFDNQRYHEVKNKSDIFRIHLIVDLMPNHSKE